MTEKFSGLSSFCRMAITKCSPVAPSTSNSTRALRFRVTILLVSGCKPSGIGLRAAMSAAIAESVRMLTGGIGFLKIDFHDASRHTPSVTARRPKPSAKNEPGAFARFDDLVGRVLSVPHSRIKEQLRAEAERKRQSKRSSASVRASHNTD